MLLRLVLGVVRMFRLLCWTGTPGDRSLLRRCVHVPTLKSTFLSPKEPWALPPASTKTPSPLVTATSWAQSWSGSNHVQQANKMQQLMLTWLKSQLISWWLLFPSACLQWLSLAASQCCNFLHITLDLLFYYCLQNAESGFCMCGKSCWERSPLWLHLLPVSHFSFFLLIVQLCSFKK